MTSRSPFGSEGSEAVAEEVVVSLVTGFLEQEMGLCLRMMGEFLVTSRSPFGSEGTVVVEVEPFLRSSYRLSWSPPKAGPRTQISDSRYFYWFHHARSDQLK